MAGEPRVGARQILLVEDNPGDVVLTQEALSECKIQVALNVVSDGVEAEAFLRRRSPFENAPRPELILLDLNLPRKSGRELLQEVKRDPDLRSIPIVVLTSSDAAQDVLDVYEGYANSYVTKPSDLDRYIRVLNQVVTFWFEVARLATRGRDRGA